MDCAACAATIITAVEGIDAALTAQVSLANETLTVSAETGDVPTATIEQTVRQLGFGVAPRDAGSAAQTPWWAIPKVRHLGLSLLATVLGFAVVHLLGGHDTVVFTAIASFAIFPVAKRAVMAARLGAVFTIQMLMMIAAIGAVIIGEQLEALLVVLLFTLGEILEAQAAQKARSGIKALGALLPKDAWLLDGNTPRQVPAESLQQGQRILVRPGDRMPADGTIETGTSSLDESPLTGESLPVTKSVGEDVFAGSVNHDAALTVTVTKPAEDNTISRIIAMVENAQDAKAPTERFIERFSKVYMPIVLALALAVAILPPLLAGADWATWTYRALALLLIGCPCALVISVPAAIAASLAAGARHGILIKGGAVMEDIAQVRTVVFDKTGTLTEGAPRVTDVIAFSGSNSALLGLALGLEQSSSHPLAAAICAHARSEGASAVAVENPQIVPGKGMEATAGGKPLFIGAPKYAAERVPLPEDAQTWIAALEDQGCTLAVVLLGTDVLGLIALRDEPRSESAAGVQALAEQEIGAVMMTGDNRRAATAIAARLGLTAEAEMLPEHKSARIAERAQHETVMMVGDGVNDAPALAQAQVGVAIGSGTDVALEAADAALMRNDIRDVARLTGLARRTMKTVRQNVALALGLKAIFLVTTVTGLSGLWMAVLADTGATVLVTLNAMRLLGALGKPPRADKPRVERKSLQVSPAN